MPQAAHEEPAVTGDQERLPLPPGAVFRYVSYPGRSWGQDEARLRAHAELADQLRPNESTPWILAVAFYDAAEGASLSYEAVIPKTGEPTGETHETGLIAGLAFQDEDTMKQYLALQEEKQPLVDDAISLGIDPGFRVSREFEIPTGFRLVHDRTIGNPDVHYQFPTPPAPEAAPQA